MAKCYDRYEHPIFTPQLKDIEVEDGDECKKEGSRQEVQGVEGSRLRLLRKHVTAWIQLLGFIKLVLCVIYFYPYSKSSLFVTIENVLERAFWVVVVLNGFVSALYLVSSQVNDWKNNPTGKQYQEE